MNLILASESPYRKELLERLNLSFSCVPAHINEESVWEKSLSPLEVSIELAKMKALKVFTANKNSIIIGSDQVICQGQKIFGKPKTPDNAVAQLIELQKAPHELITSVCILSKDKEVTFSNKTTLTIRKDLTKNDFIKYIEKDVPLNCAGSYKVESMGIALFDSIETTDFTSIVGLPLIDLAKQLKQFNVSIF